MDFTEEKRLRFDIPFKTPSINHLFWHRGNIKIMKTEAKVLREKIISEVQIQSDDQGYCLTSWEDKKLILTVDVHENWMTKKGSIKRVDISNREKFLVDSLFEALSLDDKCIWVHTSRKIQEVNPENFKSVIWLEELKT